MRQYFIKDGQICKDGEVLGAWTQHNVLAVNSADLSADLPSRIVLDYEYPIKIADRVPSKWQYLMSSFLAANKRCFLFGEAGVSKTASCIWAADYLMSLGLIKSVLVVGRLSLLRNAWAHDLGWTTGDKPVIIGGTKAQRDKALATPAKWYITNYEALGKFEVPKVDLVIGDETTRIKNTLIPLHHDFVAAIKDIPWRWFLTGTPSPTTIMDVYGQCVALGVHKIPSNYYVARDLLMVKKGEFNWVPRPNAMAQLQNWCVPALNIEKFAVMDGVMAPPEYVYEYAPLTQSQVDAIRKQADVLAEAYEMAVSNGDTFGAERLKPTKSNIWNKYGQQAACGIVFNKGKVIERLDTSTRDALLLQIVNKAHKSFVFVPYVAACEYVQEFLARNGKQFLLVHGGVPVMKREEIFKRLSEDDKVSGIIAVPSAISHGVNGTAANYSIWYAPPREAESYMQAKERIYRYGQTRGMVICHIYGSPEEERIYRKWNSNIQQQKKLVGAHRKVV